MNSLRLTFAEAVQTKFLLNQGLIQLDPPPVGSTLPRADGAKITFQLSGNEDVYFVPDEETDNIHACGVSEDMSPKACKIGIKPFATAGGRNRYKYLRRRIA